VGVQFLELFQGWSASLMDRALLQARHLLSCDEHPRRQTDTDAPGRWGDITRFSRSQDRARISSARPEKEGA
jgi:hypothetical protein